MNLIAKTTISLTLCLGVSTTAVLADADGDKAAKAAVEAREAQMDLIAYNTGLLGAMVKGDVAYDADVAKSAATNLNTMANMDRTTMWIEGTEQGAVDDSRAKPEVWTDAAGFAEKFEALDVASAEMIESAGTGLDAMKASMGKLGGACKACHETYRGPEND